jgi:hypothetical protein
VGCKRAVIKQEREDGTKKRLYKEIYKTSAAYFNLQRWKKQNVGLAISSSQIGHNRLELSACQAQKFRRKLSST